MKSVSARVSVLFSLLLGALAAGCAGETEEDAGETIGETTQALSSCAGATEAKGQKKIEQGQLAEAVSVFTCVIDAAPTEVAGYRGRAEAEMLQGKFSDVLRDYARIQMFVMPHHDGVEQTVFDHYSARLAAHPNQISALTGASFVHWWWFDYANATPTLNRLLQLRPNDLFGRLFRGSNRMFIGDNIAGGKADIDAAIAMAFANPHVHFIAADAYTYAQPNAPRARLEATLARLGGLDTPRIAAILANAAFAEGRPLEGAAHLQHHIELVTTEAVVMGPLAAGHELALDCTAGRTFEVAIDAVAGEPLSIRTDSPSGAIYDSLLVLLDPSGKPVVGNDDFVDYFAGFDFTPSKTGRYTLRVTTFEAASTGDLVVTSL